MKIVDYFESTPAVRATSNSQGKNIVEKPIFIDNEMNEKDVQLAPSKKGKKLNIHKLRISNYLALDNKSRLEE